MNSKAIVFSLVSTLVTLLVNTAPSFADQPPVLYSLCKSLLPQPPRDSIETLSGQKRWQEVLWLLRENGEMARANELEKVIAGILNEEPISKTLIKSPNVYLLEFKDNIQGVFKETKNVHRSMESEERAYRLDKTLGHPFHIPLTIYRSIDGKTGSLQLYLPKAEAYKNPVPAEIVVFDLITGGGDHLPAHNVLYTPDGTFASIDNSGSQHLQNITTPPVDLYYIGMWVSAKCSPDDEKSMLSVLRDCLKERSINLWKFRSLVWSISAEKIRATFSDELPDQQIEEMIKNLNYLRMI